MTPYLIVLFIPLLLGILESIPGKIIREDKYIFLVFACILIVFIGFRSNGYDYESYYNIYTEVKSGIINKSWDPAFVIICKICPSFHFMLLLMGGLSLIPLYWSIKHESPYFFFSLLIFTTTFLYPTIMGQMRQWVTICLMLYAYYRWRNNKIRFILIWLFCCALHSSAPIALLLLFSPKRLYSIKIYAALIILALIVSSILRPIFAPFVQSLSILQDTATADRVAFYNASETEKGIVIGLNTAILIRIITFALAFYILRAKSNTYASIINIYFLAIFIYILLGFIPQLGGRGSQYFVIFDCILIPCTLKYCRPLLRQVFACFFILISLLRFYQFFNDSFNRDYYVPYQFEILK